MNRAVWGWSSIHAAVLVVAVWTGVRLNQQPDTEVLLWLLWAGLSFCATFGSLAVLTAKIDAHARLLARS